MDVLASREGGILAIEMNRPHKKNALTSAMYEAMADAIIEAENDVSVRAILIAGKPEFFSAGNDLEEFMHAPPQSADSSVYRFMKALSSTQKPVVAAVAGNAVGIGTTMLLHCDMVYAADNARFSMPFTQLALCPEFASSLLLPRLMGHQRAAEKLMLGEPFSAQEAQQSGLVNRVLPVAELMTFARAQAAKLCRLSPASLRSVKRLLKADCSTAIDARILEEMHIFAAMLKSADAKEAFAAFLEKRQPNFSSGNS